MYETAKGVKFETPIGSRVIYNPIDNDLTPDSTPVDKNKIVFFSSPHKGLKRTLEVFKNFANFPELADVKLYVANPGYFPDHELKDIPNVINLGSLSHPDVIREVRNALCVFHLNNVFPETFGLVHAESNAVGTPFLSARFGATAELADHPAEFIDVSDNKAIIDRIIQWKTVDRPRVRGGPQFRLKNVLRDWIEVFKI
jgi:glycosyltransferase involved in cell wall biosynthesis